MIDVGWVFLRSNENNDKSLKAKLIMELFHNTTVEQRKKCKFLAARLDNNWSYDEHQFFVLTQHTFVCYAVR